MTNDPIDITEDVEALSAGRVDVAFERASRAFGRTPEEGEDPGPEFMELFGNELKGMVADDYIREEIRNGHLKTTVAENGDLEVWLAEDEEDAVER